MLKEILARILIGGIVVSVFALVSDLFTPKRFAGLFSAAPSVALATLMLASYKNGKSYAAIEGRSMIAGAVALAVYAKAVSVALIKWKLSALWLSIFMIPVWFAIAFGLWGIFLR